MDRKGLKWDGQERVKMEFEGLRWDGQERVKMEFGGKTGWDGMGMGNMGRAGKG